MIPQELLKLISRGESVTVEFKKSRSEVTKDVYELSAHFPIGTVDISFSG